MRKHVALVMFLIVAILVGVFGATALTTPAQAGEVGLLEQSDGVTHCHAMYQRRGSSLPPEEFIFLGGACYPSVKEYGSWYDMVPNSIKYYTYKLYGPATPTPAPTQTPAPTPRPTRAPRATRVAQATPVAQPTAGAPGNGR